MAVPRMLTLAREAAGMSQAQLAEATGSVDPDARAVSQAFISKVESGILPLTGDNLARVAAALDCPVSLLVDQRTVQGLEVTCVHHRRRHSTMTAATKRRIEALTHLTRVSVEGLLNGIELVPEAQLERLDIDQYNDPAAIARTLRASWRVASGPIPNVLSLLESVGIVVVVRPLGTRAQDAVSTWPREVDRPPLMVVNEGLPPDRQRFTITHELGHLIIHSLPSEDQEKEADQFAAEFLMPQAEIRPALVGLTTRDLPRLLEFKAQWGVSVAALIRTAKELECISDRQYKEFQMKLRRLGWHQSEPNTLPLEHPVTLNRVIDVHVNDHGYSIDDLAIAAEMNTVPFTRRYRPPANETGTPTKLRLVT